MLRFLSLFVWVMFACMFKLSELNVLELTNGASNFRTECFWIFGRIGLRLKNIPFYHNLYANEREKHWLATTQKAMIHAWNIFVISYLKWSNIKKKAERMMWLLDAESLSLPGLQLTGETMQLLSSIQDIGKGHWESLDDFINEFWPRWEKGCNQERIRSTLWSVVYKNIWQSGWYSDNNETVE